MVTTSHIPPCWMKRILLWQGEHQRPWRTLCFNLSWLIPTWSSSSESHQETRGSDLQWKHHHMDIPQLSVFLIALSYPKRRGDPTPHTPCNQLQGLQKLSFSVREAQHVCKSLTEHWCLHGHCGKGWQWFLIPCKIRQLGLFCVIPGLTIYQVQPHRPHKGRVEQRRCPTGCSICSPAQVGTDCLLFLTCSFHIVLLLSDLPPIAPSLSWYSHSSSECWRHAVCHPRWELWDRRFPAPHTPRDHSILFPLLFPERATPRLPKWQQKIYTHTHKHKHNPCAAGGEQQHQTHRFFNETKAKQGYLLLKCSISCFSETWSN